MTFSRRRLIDPDVKLGWPPKLAWLQLVVPHGDGGDPGIVGRATATTQDAVVLHLGQRQHSEQAAAVHLGSQLPERLLSGLATQPGPVMGAMRVASWAYLNALFLLGRGLAQCRPWKQAQAMYPHRLNRTGSPDVRANSQLLIPSGSSVLGRGL